MLVWDTPGFILQFSFSSSFLFVWWDWEVKHPLVKDGRPISCLWWVSPGTLLPRVWQKDLWSRTIYHSSPSLSGDTPKSNPSLVSCMCKRMRYLIMSLPESLVDLTPIANDLANVATLPTKSSDLKFHVYLGFKNCASLTRWCWQWCL